MTMPDETTANAYEEWRATVTVPPYVASKEEGAQRLLGAPFERFVKETWLAGWQARGNQA